MNEIIDYSEALARANGDTERLKQLIGLFLDDYPHRLEQMKQAIAAQDAIQLARAARDFRISMVCVGAQRARKTLMVLEGMAINNDLESAEAARLQLQDQLRELEQELLKCTEATAL